MYKKIYMVLSDRETFRAEWLGRIPEGASVCVLASGEMDRVIASLTQQAVGLLIIDAQLPIDLASWLPAMTQGARVLLAGKVFSVDEELAALAAAVVGCCSLALSEHELKTVIEVVQKGGIWVSREALPVLLLRLQQKTVRTASDDAAISGQRALQQHWRQLTSREKEIAAGVGRGESNKIIARHFGISEATIKAHLTSVFHKLEVSGRVQLALLLSSPEAQAMLAQQDAQ